MIHPRRDRVVVIRGSAASGDRGDVRMLCLRESAEPSRDLESADVRQPDIEKHYVGAELTCDAHRIVARCDALHDDTELFQ